MVDRAAAAKAAEGDAAATVAERREQWRWNDKSVNVVIICRSKMPMGGGRCRVEEVSAVCSGRRRKRSGGR